MTVHQITKYFDSKPVSKTKLRFKRELSSLRVLTILDGYHPHLEKIQNFTRRLKASVVRSQKQRLVWRARHDTSKSN